MKHSVKHILGAVFCWRTHWIRGGISHTRTPKAGPCTANQPICRMPANACLLVLASLLPCAMPRAKSPPCLAAAAVRPCAAFWPGPLLLLLRARACALCSPPAPLPAAGMPRAQAPWARRCLPSALRTCTHKNRERTKQIQNEAANWIKIDRSEVKRREGPPFPWIQSSILHPKTLTLGEEGRGSRRTKQNRRGRRGLVSQGVCCPLLSFLSPLTL